MVNCRNCDKPNIKINDDGSGFCPDCNDTFSDISNYKQKVEKKTESDINSNPNEESKHQPNKWTNIQTYINFLPVFFIMMGIAGLLLFVYQFFILSSIYNVYHISTVVILIIGIIFILVGFGIYIRDYYRPAILLSIGSVLLLSTGLYQVFIEGVGNVYDSLCICGTMFVVLLLVIAGLLLKLNKQEPIGRKFWILVIVLVIVQASVSYALFDYSALTPISPNDPDFYNRYPTTPEDLGAIYIESSTLLWGNYTHDYVNTVGLLAVQISPTILDLANGFKESYPDNITQQAKAAYNYVAEEIGYIDNGLYVCPYPENTLTTKEGICGDYASLLASLLYAIGLKNVAFVSTLGDVDGIIMAHTYVAVKIPSYSPPQNTVQEKIESYLGEGWIGLDPTNSLSGWHEDFAELDPTWELHWNITNIVGVPIYGAVFTLDLDFGYDFNLGYYCDFDCELYAFEHDLDNDVTFTFELRENNVTVDREVINVTCRQDSLTEADFILGYMDDFNVDYLYDSVELYLIITP